LSAARWPILQRAFPANDTKVAALQLAQEQRQIVIVDQQEVREAKKGLFGFSLPQIKLFEGAAVMRTSTTLKRPITSAPAAHPWPLAVRPGLTARCGIRLTTRRLVISPPQWRQDPDQTGGLR
jgi:hypothetical protein